MFTNQRSLVDDFARCKVIISTFLTARRIVDLMKKLLVIGGNSDSGFRIVKRWSELGGSAAVTSRRPQLDDQAPDVECITLNPLEVDALREVLAPSEQIVVNVIGAWLRDAKRAIGDTTKSILAALPASTRYVHVSATSVYGHRPGQIINEDSPVSDTLEIGRIHAATDRAVLARPNSIVFRVPHLYGPDRERSLQRMFNGDFPVIGSGYNVMHHLHVEDFADAVVAAARGTYTGLLNVVDDGPEV